MSTTISIEDSITVGDLAEKLLLPATKLIGELMKVGVMATVNERIDFDTAQIIVEELGLDIEIQRSVPEELVIEDSSVKGTKLVKRPPVVAVMGHVDHGKTSLLDAIRGSSVVKGEAGGITQHISAYQIEHNDRPITFLDTPGHEAFAALREHGAQLTDLAIIVVAADDGVKPQTVEAIRFAKKAGVKMIIAINKIDKPEANPNLVKQQLAENNVMVEGFGGDVTTVEVSAKNNLGIDKLLDMVLLVSDIEELKAYSDIPGTGLIIESHMENGRGAVAEALVEGGVLKPGDFIVAGSSYARIRNLESTSGKPIKEAGPSTPVLITGFKSLADFGDRFVVVNSEKEARAQSAGIEAKKNRNDKLDINSSELIRMINRNNDVTEFNIILKADVQGSLTSVIDSLKSLDTDEVAVRIVATGVGPLSENDINLAHSSQAVVYGFNVTVPKNIEMLARRHVVDIRMFDVIYELIDDVKTELTGLLKPVIVEKHIGELEVKGIFKTMKALVICGGEVTEGKITVPALARVSRAKEVIADELELVNAKRGPQDVKEVLEGELCGISLKTKSKLELEIGDKVEIFVRDTVERSI